MAFWNALVSYGIVLAVFICVGAIAVFLGITMRKRKNAKESEGNAGDASGEKLEQTPGQTRELV